jgi:anti-sigma B factor antagonist
MADVIRQPDLTIIELGESYDSLELAALEEMAGVLLGEATHADPPRLLLDLSNTTFIGSTFLRVLLEARKRLRTRGGTMALCGVREFCDEVFRAAKLDVVWTTYSSRREALAAMSTGAAL